MTVEALIQKKEKAEKDIRYILFKLSEETGLLIDDVKVNIDNFHEMGSDKKTSIMYVSIDMKL